MSLILCNKMDQFFIEKDIKIFTLDSVNSKLCVDDKHKQNKQFHSEFFRELKLITDTLHELQCDYSIDSNGDILIGCNKECCTI